MTVNFVLKENELAQPRPRRKPRDLHRMWLVPSCFPSSFMFSYLLQAQVKPTEEEPLVPRPVKDAGLFRPQPGP